MIRNGEEIKVLESKQSEIKHSCNSRANNSRHTGSTKPIIDLIQDLMATYIATEFD